jgi:hypothetical protein
VNVGLLALLGSMFLPVAGAAAGQTAQPPVQRDAAEEHRWEVELYAGGISGAGSIDGSGQLPLPGPVLVQTVQGMTRSIPTFPTWYFGAGADYLNTGLVRRGLQIDPLDRVLTTASATPEGGATIGVRIGRWVTRRARVEVSAEHSRTAVVLTREARDQLEAARASFVPLFTGLSSPVTTFSATSNMAVRESGNVTAITGALAFDLLSRRRITPFALVGGGVSWRAADAPSIALSGSYVAEFGQLFRTGIEQTDNVTVRYSFSKHRPVAIVGGGIRYALSERLTARFDTRVSFTREDLTIAVDASPTTRSTIATGGAALVIFSSPPPFSLDFSSSPAGDNSLRGPALNDVVTFSGSGTQARFSLSAGLGWRF